MYLRWSDKTVMLSTAEVGPNRVQHVVAFGANGFMFKAVHGSQLWPRRGDDKVWGPLLGGMASQYSELSRRLFYLVCR